MAKQTINIGTSANKGDGDPLRTAFTKINQNFDELYASGFNDPTNTASDIIPSVNNTYNLGSSTNRWSDLHVNDFIYLNGQRVEVTASGAILINGSAAREVKDTVGSVFSDDSTLLIDGLNSAINLDGTVKGNIIPDTDVAYDLGSATNRFRDLYLSGSSIDLGGTTLSVVGGVLQVGGTSITDVVKAGLASSGVIEDRSTVGADTTFAGLYYSNTGASIQAVNDPEGDVNSLSAIVEASGGVASLISFVQTEAGDEGSRVLATPGLATVRVTTPANGTFNWDFDSDGILTVPGAIKSEGNILRLDAGTEVRIGTNTGAGYVILGEPANNTHVSVASDIDITGSTTGNIANFNQYRVPTALGNTRLTGEFLEFQGASQISAPLNGPYSRLAIDVIDRLTYESNGLAGSGVDTLVVPTGVTLSLDWKFWDADTETVYDITGVVDNGDFTYTLTIPGYTFGDDIEVTYILFNPTANDDATVRNIVVDQSGTLEGITGIVGASFLDGVGRISTPDNGDLYIVSSTGFGTVTNVLYNNNATYGAYESHLGTVDFTSANRVLGPDKTPASSVGAVGDKAKEISFDANYVYYCTADFDGVTNIWKRVAWSGDTW